MAATSTNSPNRFPYWGYRNLPDYTPIAPRLPVLEESVTQIEAGEFPARVVTASSPEVALIQAHVIPKSVGITVAKPGHIGFAIPHWWKGDYSINGVPACLNTLYFPDGGQSCHIAGSKRVTTGVFLLRERFVESVAALSGVDPDEVTLDAERLRLAPAAATGLRSKLNAVLARELELQHNGIAKNDQTFEDEVLNAIVDAYLSAAPTEPRRRSVLRSAYRIVRKAEERFADTQEGRVSLADLCQAAGVGKSALYEAFHFVCGQAPMEYFHKRKLTAARSALIASILEPGAVKQAARGAGFTELGRFSSQYRKLFGELPSVTLTRNGS